ncbi:MAG: class I SAM-dependent methyltransferase [Alphaproteobacteria bacterium]|nr:class I SAM-dependent methyltransferase [Alphaproteobacteria bacterium]
MAAYRVTWETKPALRAIYQDYYRHILAASRSGKVLEIGGGSGHLRDYHADAVLTDIQPAPWVDAAADAQALPFADETFDTIVMLDVLHHIEHPPRFFREAARILKPGGRLVMLDPAITPVSNIIFRLTHPEPVNMRGDAFADGEPDPARDPYDANQAVPTLIFGRAAGRGRFDGENPTLTIKRVSRLSLFAYPLSGGFRPWSLIPVFLVRPVLKLENLLLPLIGWALAFRMLVVVERQ